MNVEYKVIRELITYSSTLEETLNMLATSGWEIVSSSASDSWIVVILERRNKGKSVI